MLNKTLLTVAACLMAMVFAAPAHAQRHMGICTEFNPDGLAGCTIENPLTGTLGDLTDPSFSVAVNDGISIDQVVLLVLSPGASAPTYTAAFTHAIYPGPTVGSTSTIASAETFSLVSNDLLIASITSLSGTIASGVDWSFNNINNVQLQSGITQYEVDVFFTGIGIDGITLTNPSVVRVDITGTMLTGTIFLAIGLDSSGNVLYSMPLTRSLQLVPEPGTLTLLGSGLFALGFLRRKQFFG